MLSSLKTGSLFVLAIVFLTLAPTAKATSISVISSNFNGTAVPSGSFIWFTAVGKLAGSSPSTPFTVDLTNSQITFTSTDASDTPIVVNAPNAAITFGPSGTIASTSFSSGAWDTTAAFNASGNVFLDAVAFQIPSGISITGANPVTWTASFSTNASSPFTLNWAWAAAAYSSSCTAMGSTSTYGSLNVQPADTSIGAGTPNTCGPISKYLEPGARGGGGSNWTGSLSGTIAVTPTPAPVPEPGTLSLFGCGLLGLAGLWRRKLRNS
jgi:PEP-CTERM motif-containing protein